MSKEEEKAQTLTNKIMTVIIDNFEGMNYTQILKESEEYDWEAINPHTFYSAIRYDILKILRGK